MREEHEEDIRNHVYNEITGHGIKELRKRSKQTNVDKNVNLA